MGSDESHGIRVYFPSSPWGPHAKSILRSGYTETCRKIVSASRNFASSLRTRFPDDIRVLGDPLISVVAFTTKSEDLNIYAIGDRMGKKGWHLNALANPAALHMAFTVRAFASCAGDIVDETD
jgi:glutamate/tyrosine decarboxylase-like PLP-dependent enzyme